MWRVRNTARFRWGEAFGALAFGAAALLASALAGAAADDLSGSDGASRDVCVDVRIGQETYYDCLNQKLRRLAEQSHGAPLESSVTATSPAPAVGTYNQAATRERMGNAFGISAFPQRPPPPVYVNPLINPLPR